MGFPTGGSSGLPAGAATSAKQDTGNASLASIVAQLTEEDTSIAISYPLSAAGVIHNSEPTGDITLTWQEE